MPNSLCKSTGDAELILTATSVRVRSFSGPVFPAFGLNTEIYSVNLRIHSECGKIQTRKTLNMDNFHAVSISLQKTAFKVFIIEI